VPSFINRLKQETVLQGKSFAVLEMQQSKPEPKTAQAADKPNPRPQFIEFDLRTSGMDKELPKPVAAVEAAIVPPSAPLPAPAPAPAPVTPPVPPATAASQAAGMPGVSAP